jgi:hypothetical protein
LQEHGLVRRRGPWLIAALALVAGAIAAVPVVNTDFYRALVATYIGAVIGFMVALYVDRLQRSEDDAAQRRRDADTRQQESERDAALARVRRVEVLSLLREELGRVPDQMGQRQVRNSPPTDVMTDILWQSLSSSGDLRWITDLDLLRKIASAYDLLRLQIDVEAHWLNARAPGKEVGTTVDGYFRNLLVRHDRDTWSAACTACTAMDVALVADGAAAGSNADRLFCP